MSWFTCIHAAPRQGPPAPRLQVQASHKYKCTLCWWCCCCCRSNTLRQKICIYRYVCAFRRKNQSFTMFLKHQGRKLFKHRYMIFCQNFSERNIIFHHFRKNFSWGWDYSLHTQSPTQENPLISCTFCSTLIYKITIRLWLHVCWCPLLHGISGWCWPSANIAQAKSF